MILKKFQVITQPVVSETKEDVFSPKFGGIKIAPDDFLREFNDLPINRISLQKNLQAEVAHFWCRWMVPFWD